MVRLNGPRWELELGGEGYPQSLVELQNPPEVLRGIGDREVLSGPCLAVIGARRATPYGIAAAELAGRVAAECGVTVVSGGAMGCDYAAGMAAAAAGGRTIVVAGTGADVPYPASSTPVFQAAVDSGAVVSLERWGQTPRRYAFPRRNAVVAALCKVLVITEAGQVSGTMSTADAALELGRTLYAIPGSIFSPNSSGTNRLAAEGAPDGTAVLTGMQTAGRGRRGRTFVSPPGGLYFSLILRPHAQPEALMHLTAMVAVAAARAIERVSGVYPGIKWTNDLVLGKKKLCGILTEIGIEAESREVDYAVVGIGINCAHAELPPEVAAMSADLETATGKKPDRSRLAAELVRSLYEMEQALFTQKDAWLAEFSAHCVTIGQDVKLVRGDEVQFAHADGIDGEAALRVTYPDGTAGVIASGEVSVRGMYGYT